MVDVSFVQNWTFSPDLVQTMEKIFCKMCIAILKYLLPCSLKNRDFSFSAHVCDLSEEHIQIVIFSCFYFSPLSSLSKKWTKIGVYLGLWGVVVVVVLFILLVVLSFVFFPKILLFLFFAILQLFKLAPILQQLSDLRSHIFPKVWKCWKIPGTVKHCVKTSQQKENGRQWFLIWGAKKRVKKRRKIFLTVKLNLFL